MIYSYPKPKSSHYIFDHPVIKEKHLIQKWGSLGKGHIIYIRNSKPIMVIDPGKENYYNGPDFLNAQLFMNGEMILGDVEIHVNEASWIYHGHHQDKRYDSVILHVVNQFSLNAITSIPTAKLDVNTQYKVRPVCSLDEYNVSQNVFPTLQILGGNRWKQRIDLFKLTQNHTMEYFLEQTLAILGSKGNECAFQSLGKKVLQEIKGTVNQDDVIKLFNEVAQTLEWNTRGIRPAKHPRTLIPKVAKLFHSIITEYSFIMSKPLHHDRMVEKLKYFGFGQGLITEWMGNVLLPFLGAHAIVKASLNGYIQLKQEWMELSLPYTYGKVQRQFGHFLPAQSLKNFSILQGFLELESNYCSKTYCLVCPCKGSRSSQLR
ncbi:MAG: DUF2851 family protein [Candidatus Marinimicrobia bacterium]|nr:DUF2851 family protein [Candidatus Neomarinimicrobiota bacterium]MBT4734929.1 DUF2851 family protein [Candidatus Neomarinimicrobiota bacterium]MBT6113782.1 DUF2851 family protein [Candidatus Neomarinimicrobiota bacterium]MBT6939326.1 DUF2851 family protein [Candidatus Neomarinimicrobiota bacterium]MBT7269317.1 DUF2851 family protein [Candidatus Neomarinimicrobiota bacterium]